MRISDWSSDVCSSDLSSAGDDEIRVGDSGGLGGDDLPQIAGDALATGEDGDAFASNFVASVDGNTTGEHSAGNDTITAGDGGWFLAGRSEERRVGKGWYSKWRSRWSPAH